MAVGILVFLGVLALVGSGALFLQAQQARRGIVVEGTIVAAEISHRRDIEDPGVRMMSAAPVVEYTDRNGQTHQVTSKLSNSRMPQVGGTIRVSYRPDDPSKAVVLMPGMAVPRWFFLIVGVACIVGAIAEAMHHHHP